MNKITHLKISKKYFSPYVLLVGDPARLDIIGSFLDKKKEIFNEREFRVIWGKYKNLNILAVSTGIGCPSTAIAVEELINFGCQYFIRIGTCGGSWNEKIKEGSLIIPSAAIREEGTSREYINLSYPAVADFKVIGALNDSANIFGVKSYVGINRTHDAFYGNVFSKMEWQRRFKTLKLKNSPIISSDMETSIIYVIASLRGVRAGAVLAVNAQSEPLLNKNYFTDPRIEVDKNTSFKVVVLAVKVGLEALNILSKKV